MSLHPPAVAKYAFPLFDPHYRGLWRHDPYRSDGMAAVSPVQEELRFAENNPRLFDRAIQNLTFSGSTNALPHHFSFLRACARYFSRSHPKVKTEICHYYHCCQNGQLCAFAHVGELLRTRDDAENTIWTVVTERVAELARQRWKHSLPDAH